MDSRDDIARYAKEAEFLLRHELLELAFKRLRAEAVETLLSCEVSELAERRADIVAIDRLKGKLQAFFDGGKVIQT
jgi:hypothetical protein